MMRRALQLVFVLFYVASSYAITQERTSLQADQIRHSSSKASHTQIDKSCAHLVDGYPSYRQAKPKPGCELYFWWTESVHFLPHTSERPFHAQTFSFKPLNSLETALLRAPPVEL